LTFAIPLFCFALLLVAGGPGFRSSDLLHEHFLKHGHEFGNITEQQYLRMAQRLRDARPGKEVLESRRPDGGGAKFDRKRGWFVAYDPSGAIRTFFVPAEGIRYFELQTRTYGGRPR
jgi:pyocin large subunit-like protein